VSRCSAASSFQLKFNNKMALIWTIELFIDKLTTSCDKLQLNFVTKTNIINILWKKMQKVYTKTYEITFEIKHATKAMPVSFYKLMVDWSVQLHNFHKTRRQYLGINPDGWQSFWTFIQSFNTMHIVFFLLKNQPWLIHKKNSPTVRTVSVQVEEWNNNV